MGECQSPDWAVLIAEKQSRRAALIPTEWRLEPKILNSVSETSPLSALDVLKSNNLLTEREVEITESYDAQELLQMLAAGTISSVEVTTAFCKRAAIAQQLINVATEIFFTEAIERAKYLDDYLATQKKPLGPFHGLPISVKDCWMVKGQYATVGFVARLHEPVVADHNSYAIDVLLNNGAVLYIKTNIPQTMQCMDSVNNVFGRTLNPQKATLTAGGSSGGEGALVGFRGSILGFGSDHGGSIRAPSLCCGCFGFKPTASRIPFGRQAPERMGAPGPLCSSGPIATSAGDCTLFFRTIIQSKPWEQDPSALFLPWREVPKKSVLKVGVWFGDAEYPLSPPIARALKSAAAKLGSGGHDIEVLEGLPSPKDLTITLMKYAMMDTKRPRFGLLRDAQEEPIKALSYTSPFVVLENREYTIEDLWDANVELEMHREKLLRLWTDKKLDVLLCTGSMNPATPHDEYGMPIYTLYWNLVDFPASVIPYLTVDKSVDTTEGYDAGITDGAPCSVQVVGWQYQDEEVLAATETIAELLKA